MKDDKHKIFEILDTYVQAFESADADLMESLFWTDDPRFIEVENHISEPFGRERFLALWTGLGNIKSRGGK